MKIQIEQLVTYLENTKGLEEYAIDNYGIMSEMIVYIEDNLESIVFGNKTTKSVVKTYFKKHRKDIIRNIINEYKLSHHLEHQPTGEIEVVASSYETDDFIDYIDKNYGDLSEINKIFKERRLVIYGSLVVGVTGEYDEEGEYIFYKQK